LAGGGKLSNGKLFGSCCGAGIDCGRFYGRPLECFPLMLVPAVFSDDYCVDALTVAGPLWLDFFFGDTQLAYPPICFIDY
jgi:hypothetical protein